MAKTSMAINGAKTLNGKRTIPERVSGILTMFLAKTIGIMDHKNPKTLDPVHLQAIHFPKCRLRKLRKKSMANGESEFQNPKLVIMYL